VGRGRPEGSVPIGTANHPRGRPVLWYHPRTHDHGVTGTADGMPSERSQGETRPLGMGGMGLMGGGGCLGARTGARRRRQGVRSGGGSGGRAPAPGWGRYQPRGGSGGCHQIGRTARGGGVSRRADRKSFAHPRMLSHRETAGCQWWSNEDVSHHNLKPAAAISKMRKRRCSKYGRLCLLPTLF